ncbi:unnamed protein product [Ophioblennius macclurei]
MQSSSPQLATRHFSPGVLFCFSLHAFSGDQFILDCPSEKLRRELEEELKMNCEDPRSHAWYHGEIPRQVAEKLVQRDGDFLVRDSLSIRGNYVLTCQWRNSARHFKINKKVVMLNEAYSRVEYRVEREGFDSVPALIRYYVGNRKPVSQVVGAIIFQPINRAAPLCCLEEKYSLPSSDGEAGLVKNERQSQKRLSLNITNRHNVLDGVQDDMQAGRDAAHCQDNGLVRNSKLRLSNHCGSHPAGLNQVQERRRTLKAHQSDSFLPLVEPQRSLDQLLASCNHKPPVFRTDSAPALSPSASRRSTEPLAGSDPAVRGSDNQLCPKPPPKPSKVPLARLAQSTRLQLMVPPLPPPTWSNSTNQSSCNPPCLAAPPQNSSCANGPVSSWRSEGPPIPPLKPLKFKRTDCLSSSSYSSSAPPPPENAWPTDSEEIGEKTFHNPVEWEQPNLPMKDHHPEPQVYSYVERLKAEGKRWLEEVGGDRGLDRSSYHHAIAALDNTSENEDDDSGGEEEAEEEVEEKEVVDDERKGAFQRPVEETESSFRPAKFSFRLLPPENKPLEMLVLKRAKELLLSHDHRSIARHLLRTDCQVARILGVTQDVRRQMGVSTGLELVTLPHGRQLRLDLMERHHTMAIGVAVDILGCTGSVEERASTLNRIILVAIELKDAVGDLFAFTALMKALDLQQISRLEETWTTLRRNFTQTAVTYEKVLKPFYKNLYEGTAPSPPVVCVPLLLPLLTLMERSSVTPEGAELWETNDQGCDIMLRHLEAARDVARNAQSYAVHAQEALRGFQFDEDLLEVLKTDFQMRLLWGSRGALVNQSDRYNKFNLILTALSRKLEPPPKTQTLI